MINSALEKGRPVGAVLPLSLCITSADRIAVPIVKRGTSLPIRKEMDFSADLRSVSAVGIELTMGERMFADDNRKIALLRVPGIKKTVGKVPKVTVCIEIAKDGRMRFSAYDHGSRHKDSQVFQPYEWMPSNKEISEIEAAAKAGQGEDSLKRRGIELLDQCRETAEDAKKAALSPKAELALGERMALLRNRTDLKKQIKNTDPAKITGEDILDLRSARENLLIILSRI